MIMTGEKLKPGLLVMLGPYSFFLPLLPRLFPDR
jgi:hypothetical protein